eukprot:scaffold5586_cov124-Isochrysis_galbana.AAC.5
MSRVSSLLLAVATLAASAAATEHRERRSPGHGINFRRRADRRAISMAYMATDLTFEGKVNSDSSQYLIQFRGKGDDYCTYMEPLKERLKKELGLTIRCFEVWYDSRNLELLQKLDRGRCAPAPPREQFAGNGPLAPALIQALTAPARCNGVPFFYNKKTKQFICGATSYDNLKTWATGGLCENFLAPADLKAPGQEEGGMKNRLQEMIAAVKARGQAVLDSRSRAEEEEPQ